MFSTEIHPTTFVYICILVIMLIPTIRNLSIKNPKGFHRDFLLLVIAVLMNNLSSGLLPDENIPINILSQNIIAYTIGFISILYYFLYISKYYNLNFKKYLSFHSILIFLSLDLVVGFILPYTITGNLRQARIIFLAIPIILIVLLIGLIFKNKITDYMKYHSSIEKYHTLTGIMGLVSIISVPIIMFTLGDNQDVEQTLFSLGFFFIAIEYFSYQKSIYELSIKQKHNLTDREAELIHQLKLNPKIKYIDLSNKLNITEKTVSAHMSRVFKKVGVNNRKELEDFILKNKDKL